MCNEVIGYTKSNKAIYSHSLDRAHDKFDSTDHTEAAAIHDKVFKETNAIMNEIKGPLDRNNPYHEFLSETRANAGMHRDYHLFRI